MPLILITNIEGGPGAGETAKRLTAGEAALDAIEAGVRIVEADPSVRSVGYGGAPNLLGKMELDASVMCGRTLRTGSVAALRNYLHPVTVARQVMERLPHVMLAGEGAARFAHEIGEETAELLSPEARKDYRQWLENRIPASVRGRLSETPLAGLSWPEGGAPVAGTTTFIACGRDGNWAGGVSTSGWAYKYPGRIGDSPLIGAGLYVDNRYGAAACTQTGEMTVRAATARSVVLYLKHGATVEEACTEAAGDLRCLQGGYLGSVVIHAASRNGDHCVMGVGLEKPARYWLWTDGMESPELRPVMNGP